MAALGGAPGVRSARYAGEQATDEQNLAKLLRAMESVEDRRAAYVCALAFAEPGGEERLFEATLRGPARPRARGAAEGSATTRSSSREDSPEENLTMASLSPEQKDAISHRGRAAGLLLEWLASTRMTEARSRTARGRSARG